MSHTLHTSLEEVIPTNLEKGKINWKKRRSAHH